MLGGTTGPSVLEIVHDLRSPLAAIRSQCDLLEVALTGTQAADVACIRRVADTMAERVDAVLAGAASPGPPAPVDVGDVAIEVMRRLRPIARFRDVQLSVVAAPRALVIARAPELDSALENLMDNAIRHSPRGGVVVCHVGSQEGRITITVDDEGPGIAAADRERLLLAGERGAGGQSGLGLAIVVRIAKALRGDFQLLEAPAGGTRARLDFPAKGARERGRRGQRERRPEGSRPARAQDAT